MHLLSVGTNAKTIKSDAGGVYLTAILYLAPHTEAGGQTVCPGSSVGCRDSCLYSAGRGNMHSVKTARISKTQWFQSNRWDFLCQLGEELWAFQRKCKKLEVQPVVRLNGTSDIRWDKLMDMEMMKEIQFYDYTKIKRSLGNQKNFPSNYHLTYSRKETDGDSKLKTILPYNNIAVVFRGELPETYLGYPVINGDLTDLRFLDKPNVVVGLKAKGSARKDTSGFVVDA